MVYKVTNSVPLYYALRKIEGENCTYYYFKEELKEGETTAENPNRGINFQGAFNAAVGGDLSQWTRWDNADAPQKAKVALIPTVLSGSTVTFKASNLDILPISEWQKVDVTQETVEGWKRYQYKVNGLLITEYDNSTFYYHDKKSQEPAKAWVEFVPKRGESNTVDIDLNTSDFAQTPTRLSDAEVQANRASAANKAVENMVSWYQTNRNHYKKEYRRYQAENPAFAKRINDAVLHHYRSKGGEAVLIAAGVVAAPLILAALVEAGAYTAANFTKEGLCTFAKELAKDAALEALISLVLEEIEEKTGLPISLATDLKDAKDLLKGAWAGFLSSPLFSKTIDDNFEELQRLHNLKKNGGRSSEVDGDDFDVPNAKLPEFEDFFLKEQYDAFIKKQPTDLVPQINNIIIGHENDEVAMSLFFELIDGNPRTGDLLGLSERFKLNENPNLFKQTLTYITKHKDNQVELVTVMSYLNSLQDVKMFSSAVTGNVKLTNLFRGTTAGFGGNGTNLGGGTCTSADPVIATIFALHSDALSNGKGVLKITIPNQLKKATFPNDLAHKEAEIVLEMLPTDFDKMVTKEIKASEAQKILLEMGIKLPTKNSLRTIRSVEDAVNEAPKLSPSDILIFVNKINQ